ncbi:MAG: Cna B-type domain-containing protein [Butyrivibrio sp.]|nr:Cna B-type domain-containing protein [Butyrivibrio sp.]
MKIKAIKKKVFKPLVCVMTASAVMTGVCGAENEAINPTRIFAATQDTPVLENKTGNLSWSISDGTLTFKGDKSGNIIIPDYTDNTGDNPAPWSSSKSAVGYSRIVFDCTKKVVIGENAFVRDNNNKSLGSITVKGTSGKISKGAFNGHTKISFLALYCAPAIEENAFEKDAVQRVAFYNNKPVEGLKFAIGSKTVADVHIDINSELKKQLEDIGVAKIDQNLCDKKEMSEEQPDNIFKTTYKCSVCGYSQTSPSSFKTNYIVEGIDSKFFENYKKSLEEKGIELKDTDVRRKERTGVTVASDSGKLEAFKDMFGYKIDRDHFVVTDSKGNTIATSSCDAGFTPEKYPEKITSRSEEFNIKMKYTPADTVFHLNGGEHYKKELKDIHRDGLVLKLPELKSDERNYEFIGWKLEKINDRNIDILNSNNLYDESKIIKAGEYDLVDFYTDMALLGKDTGNCDYTFKAVWTELGSFDLVFDPNGAAGTAITEKRFLNPDKAEPAGEHFETAGKPGYIFTGWNTEPDGKGISIDVLDKVSGASFGNTEIEKNTKVTLYAQWAAPRKVNIAFEWNDNDNSDGRRPENIDLKLVTSSKIRTEDNIYNISTDKNSELIVPSKHAKAAFDSNGEIKEFATADSSMEVRISDSFRNPHGYVAEIKSPSENNYVISMSYVNQKTSREVKISFKDNDNNDGKRPSELKLVLKDKEDKRYEKEVKINGTENVAEFKDLNVWYGKGLKNEFVLATPEAKGYTFKVNGTTITAEHKDETVDYTVKTVWKDNNDAAKKRPDTYSVTLEGDGNNRYTQNISGNGANTIEGAKHYYRGKEIAYNVSVSSISGYTSDVSVNGNEITVTYEYKEKESTTSDKTTKNSKGKTNTTRAKSTSPVEKRSSGDGSKQKSSNKDNASSRLQDDDYSNFTVRLIWDDEGNKEGRKNVTVALIGSDDNSYSGLLTEENGYTYVFSHIPLIEEDGTIIKYNVVPNTISGYKSSVYTDRNNPVRFTITNRKDTEKTVGNVVENVVGSKELSPVLEDASDHDGKGDLGELEISDLNMNKDYKQKGLIGIAVAIGTVLTAIVALLFIKKKKRR